METKNNFPGKIKLLGTGFISGLLNGLFGSGGGLAAVPLLEALGTEPKKSHATSVAIIFVMSLISAIGYFLGGAVDLSLTLSFIPGGIIGVIFGSLALKSIDNSLLRRIFGALLIYSGIRIFLK